MLPAASGAGVLSPNTNTPPVTQTTVCPNLLEPLNVISQLSIKVLGKDLSVLARLEILLTIEEPKRNLELAWVLNNGYEFLNFIGGEFSAAFVHVDFCLFANEVGETTAKTLDFGEAEYDITLSFDVRVENTEDVLELRSLHQR